MSYFCNTAPSGPPQNFVATVEGNSITLSWEPPLPEFRNGIINSYTLSCDAEDGTNIDLILNAVSQISLYDLSPNTEYTCRVAASTAPGMGPYTADISVTTEGTYLFYEPYQNHRHVHLTVNALPYLLQTATLS